MIRQLDWTQMKELYMGDMQKDFPPGELKPIELLERMHQMDLCKAYVLCDEEDKNTYHAYAIFEKPKQGNVWLLDYFAVNSDTRGKGYGSSFLKELPQVLEEAEAAMAEIERLEDATDEEELKIRSRRKQFYLRNGLLETGIHTKADGGIYYDILCIPVKRAVCRGEAAHAMQRIYETLFEPGEYEIFCSE